MQIVEKIKHGPKWVRTTLILLAAFLIAALLVATKSSPPKTDIKEKEWLVSTEKLVFGDSRPQLALLGRVESPFSSQLTAAISADVVNVPVREGDHVNAGDILIKLDAREINLLLQQTQADIDDLSAQIKAEKNRYQSDVEAFEQEQKLLTISKKAVARQAKLTASNLVAQERFDQAESQQAQSALSINARKLSIDDHPNRLKQLEAKLARAKTKLSDAKLDAERTVIKAPFEGVITSVNVSPGERVQVAQALTGIYDINNVEVRAQLPNRYVETIKASLQNGLEISAHADSFGKIVAFKLARLSGQANQGSGGVDALFKPVADQEHLILNSTLSLALELPSLSGVATIPSSSIYGANRIYRLRDGRLEAINVEILGKQIIDGGQSRIIIKSESLRPEDLVITTQLPNAITGLKVKQREL